MRFTSFFLAFCLFSSLFAEQKQDVSKISEGLGHLIGKNIQTIGIDLDIELVVKGLRDAIEGKNSPLTESECIDAITVAQEKAFKEIADANLKKAENFLQENAKNKNVVILDEGKIQYKIEKTGKGETVTSESSPLIRYVGRYLDGSIFGESKDDEVVSLEETIQGFQKGLIGMKEGEKRILYIHPTYGYGTQGICPPNSLLSFEIEVIKANSVPKENKNSLILESDYEKKSSIESDTAVMR